MVTANFETLLRTIAIILILYYGIRFFMRVFGPMLLQQVVRKAGENMYQQQQQYQQQHQQYNRQQQQNNVKEPPKEKEQVGEYIDFEELD